MLAASVSLHVRKHSALVSPEVILGAKEEDWELSDLMSEVLDVGRNVSGVVDLCRPPSEEERGSISVSCSGLHMEEENTKKQHLL